MNPVPEALPLITPHLIVKDAARAIDFYRAALDCNELYRVADPGGRILFAELLLGSSRIFLVDEFPEQRALSPLSLGGSPVTLHVYFSDVDRAYRRAVQAGMTVEIPLADFFWGERYGSLRDPFGLQWAAAFYGRDRS